MKKNFKGLLAIWMAAAMMLAMMLPAAAAENYFTYDREIVFSEGDTEVEVYDNETAASKKLNPPESDDTLVSAWLGLTAPTGKTLSKFSVWGGYCSGNLVVRNYANHEEMAADAKFSDVNAFETQKDNSHDNSCVIIPIWVSAEDTPEKEESTSRGGAFLLFWFFHDVDFVIDEETTETVYVRYGERIVAPEVTAPEGYEFTGWYTDADCTEAFDLETKFRSDVIREV
ncbi:MAG: InlB B-repeat-containing protein, partial [Clostridia bacterium]|nr:InlB B-repeat-containing protein [Clostridia bacterium]